MRTESILMPSRIMILLIFCHVAHGGSDDAAFRNPTHGGVGLMQGLGVVSGKSVEHANAWIHDVDVDAIADQCAELGVDWYFAALMVSEFVYARNETYDRLVGDDRYTVERDLVRELGDAMRKRGISFGLYVPADLRCRIKQTLPEIREALGWDIEKNTATEAFGENVRGVLLELGERYGDIVDFVWIDTAGTRMGFPDWSEDNRYHSKAYHEPLKRHGVQVAINPGAFRAFEPADVDKELMDYLAGETGDPLEVVLPKQGLFEGIRWHNLCHLGSNWSKPDTTHTPEDWQNYLRAVRSVGGSVTISLAYSGKGKRIPDEQFQFLKLALIP